MLSKGGSQRRQYQMIRNVKQRRIGLRLSESMPGLLLTCTSVTATAPKPIDSIIRKVKTSLFIQPPAAVKPSKRASTFLEE